MRIFSILLFLTTTMFGDLVSPTLLLNEEQTILFEVEGEAEVEIEIEQDQKVSEENTFTSYVGNDEDSRSVPRYLQGNKPLPEKETHGPPPDIPKF